MPGYEPFLLCDFHVHTHWSDGQLSVAEVVDLYGRTGKFDVIAITDHILMKKDMLARGGPHCHAGTPRASASARTISTPTSRTSGSRPAAPGTNTACSSFPEPK